MHSTVHTKDINEHKSSHLSNPVCIENHYQTHQKHTTYERNTTTTTFSLSLKLVSLKEIIQ